MKMLTLLTFVVLQLENSDEQAACIRRELDARREKLQEMQSVSFTVRAIATGDAKYIFYCQSNSYRLCRFQSVSFTLRAIATGGAIFLL